MDDDALRALSPEIGHLALAAPGAGPWRRRAGRILAQQPAAMEQLQPLAIADIGLPPRYVVQLAGVDQDDRDPAETRATRRRGSSRTEVLSMATDSTRCATSHAARACRSSVVVPNARTLGVASVRAGPQTQCSALPISMPATRGRTTGNAVGIAAGRFLCSASTARP